MASQQYLALLEASLGAGNAKAKEAVAALDNEIKIMDGSTYPENKQSWHGLLGSAQELRRTLDELIVRLVRTI